MSAIKETDRAKKILKRKLKKFADNNGASRTVETANSERGGLALEKWQAKRSLKMKKGKKK